MSATPDPDAMAAELLREVNGPLLELSIEAQRAAWIYETHLTEDTEAIASRAEARVTLATGALALRAARIPAHPLGEGVARQLGLLKLSLPMLAPSDPRGAEELSRLVASMRGRYGMGRFRPSGAPEPLDLEGLSRRMRESRDPRELSEIWSGWHAIARPMKPEFQRFVELANRGARELGFEDTGSMWRSKYDLAPAAFEREVERLWRVVEPLYKLLHAFVRKRLGEFYGPSVVPSNGPIPAHLLGNMWAQSWEHVLPLLGRVGPTAPVDLTGLLTARGVDARELVRYGERFFLSLGFPALPDSFWERSQFVRPRDREVLCHASAWDVDYADDLRIKMCIEITGEEFGVVHHELGHSFYQRAYKDQPFLFRDSANDGFHEAVGDTIGLSVTPDYLVRIGLLTAAPPMEDDRALLLQRALEKIAFLPFGLLVDRWRWRVFSGEVGPDSYTSSWTEMRREYQGVAPPIERSESDFDPGAKAHIPMNTPYMRYFLAQILQFQFHRAFARQAGWRGPLHRFSIHGDEGAGSRLRSMFAMGASRPWPDALEVITGTREMDPTAILDYFEPLRSWLRTQLDGAPVGW